MELDNDRNDIGYLVCIHSLQEMLLTSRKTETPPLHYHASQSVQHPPLNSSSVSNPGERKKHPRAQETFSVRIRLPRCY